MTRDLSTLGNLKALLVGYEPFNSSDVVAYGCGVFALHEQLPATLQDGAYVGYITQRGGIYQGGQHCKRNRDEWGYSGGQLLGYVTRNGLINGRDSHLHLAIYRGGRYDASYRDGKFCATAGFDKEDRCSIFDRPDKQHKAGHTSAYFSNERCYIYLDGYFKRQRVPIGYLRANNDLAKVGACALMTLFLSESHLEEMTKGDQKLTPDSWERGEQDRILSLAENLMSFQKTEDRLAYVEQQENKRQGHNLDVAALRQQRAVYQKTIEDIYSRLQRSVFSSEINFHAHAIFAMWKDEYRMEGGYCGICKNHLSIQSFWEQFSSSR